MQYSGIFLTVYTPIIYFVYGMSFLMLGITIAVEHITVDTTTNGFKLFIFSSVGALSIFGIIHGSVELMDMFSILYAGSAFPLKIIRLFLMSASFYFLCKFGVSYNDKSNAADVEVEDVSQDKTPGIEKNNSRKSSLFIAGLPTILFSVWSVVVLVFLIRKGFSNEWFIEGEILSRYIIGLPAAIVASIALLLKHRMKEDKPAPNKLLIIASMGFLFYAVLSGLIVPMANFYPASVFNYESFYSATHVPVQLFRSICAVLITIALLKFFRISKELFTIRFKAILHIFIAVVIPGFVIILFVCYMIADALLNLSYRENKKIAALTANRTLSFFEDVGKRIKYQTLFLQHSPNIIEKDIFMSIVSKDDDIDGIALIDENREIFRIEKATPSSLINYKGNADNSRIKKFLEVAATNMLHNNFHVQRYTDKNVLMVIPLRKGSLEILLNSDKLYGYISSSRIEKGWHTLLLDKSGDIVIPRNKKIVGEKRMFEHRAFNMGRYRKTILRNGIYYNTVEEKIPETGWSVIIEIPRNEIVAPVFRVFKGLLFGILGIYLTAVIVALIFVERVTNPINLIAQKVKLIGKGFFDQKLNVRTGDELQTLSEEIEKMAYSLMEKKRMEEKMGQTEKIASLGQLTAGIAHEINNPLGIILGYCQVMLREIEPHNKYYADLKIIEKHVLSCKRILDDLLKFSRPRRKINVEVDINTNIKESLALIPKHFSNKINTILELSPVPCRIMGDPDRLHQLFLNLTMNAIDAMKKEGGSLRIGTRIFDSKAEDIVEVIFSDTGCGIRKEDLGRIFDPFFTTKDVGKGTGLGLSVSYGIVNDHGGEICAESILGKGTTIYIIFPAAKSYAVNLPSS